MPRLRSAAHEPLFPERSASSSSLDKPSKKTSFRETPEPETRKRQASSPPHLRTPSRLRSGTEFYCSSPESVQPETPTVGTPFGEGRRSSFRARPLDINEPLLIVRRDENESLFDQIDQIPAALIISQEEEMDEIKAEGLLAEMRSIPVKNYKQVNSTIPENFVKPHSYIRFNRSNEDWDRLVEYDLDEQDEEWLKQYNTKERKKVNVLSPDDFEFLFDRLEKDLCQKLKKQQSKDAGEENGAESPKEKKKHGGKEMPDIGKLVPLHWAIDNFSERFSIHVAPVYQYWLTRRSRQHSSLLTRFLPRPEGCFESYQQHYMRKQNIKSVVKKIMMLRETLEWERLLADMIVRREKHKRRLLRSQLEILELERDGIPDLEPRARLRSSQPETEREDSDGLSDSDYDGHFRVHYPYSIETVTPSKKKGRPKLIMKRGRGRPRREHILGRGGSAHGGFSEGWEPHAAPADADTSIASSSSKKVVKSASGMSKARGKPKSRGRPRVVGGITRSDVARSAVEVSSKVAAANAMNVSKPTKPASKKPLSKYMKKKAAALAAAAAATAAASAAKDAPPPFIAPVAPLTSFGLSDFTQFSDKSSGKRSASSSSSATAAAAAAAAAASSSSFSKKKLFFSPPRIPSLSLEPTQFGASFFSSSKNDDDLDSLLRHDRKRYRSESPDPVATRSRR